MTRPDYWHPRPYVEGQRFTGGGKYWRPSPRLQWWFFMAPEVKAAAWWSVAWTATTVLTGLRVWRAMAQHDDEIGD